MRGRDHTQLSTCERALKNQNLEKEMEDYINFRKASLEELKKLLKEKATEFCLKFLVEKLKKFYSEIIE